MSSWNAPICESCWIDRAATWDMTEDPPVLLQVRVPTTVLHPSLEQCGFCGGPTVVGIYVRADPKLVPYPPKEGS